MFWRREGNRRKFAVEINGSTKIPPIVAGNFLQFTGASLHFFFSFLSKLNCFFGKSKKIEFFLEFGIKYIPNQKKLPSLRIGSL
jgi:hypothetical protein